MEDFKYMDGFSNYGFTRDGRIFSHLSGRWIAERNTGDYVVLSLKNDKGEVVSLSRHRCFATLFVEGRSEENKIVNHLNGIPGDDRPENLEWTTYRGNHEHAGMMGLTEKCQPISVRNPNTGEIRHYPSATSAGLDLGLSKDNILWRINAGEERIFPEGLQYRRRDDSRPWTDLTENRFGRSVPVLLRNTMTGEVQQFAKESDVANAIGSCLATVNIAAASGDQRLIQGIYQVKHVTDNTPWREIVDRLREHGLKQPVIVINEVTGQETVYESAKSCAEAMGILTTTLNERLKSNGSKVFKGFRFKRY